jgi:hypothetical protein
VECLVTIEYKTSRREASSAVHLGMCRGTMCLPRHQKVCRGATLGVDSSRRSFHVRLDMVGTMPR